MLWTSYTCYVFTCLDVILGSKIYHRYIPCIFNIHKYYNEHIIGTWISCVLCNIFGLFSSPFRPSWVLPVKIFAAAEVVLDFSQANTQANNNISQADVCEQVKINTNI